MSNATSSFTSGTSTLRPDGPASDAGADGAGGPDVITVLVVDDHPGFRRALERALRRSPGLRLVGSAGCGDEAIVISARLEPRVVVMDLAMPGMSGVEATRRLMGQPSPPAVVALSGSRELMRDAIAAGACRALLKEGDLTELLTTIRLAAAR
ncbi:MAG TPA: response regulator transcription factor [Solirubrobacteraceae bacterium]|nr:response regulator transcription factor [Solirubrobacteraceae bacterium]